MTAELSKSAISLPPPEGGRRRWAWPLPIVIGLCAVPAYHSTARHVLHTDERSPPTHKVVEALHQSMSPPYRTAAEGSIPQLQKSADSPLGLTLGNSLQLAAKPLFLGPAGDRERAIDCLATAAWYEAGNDIVSQQSVIQVVLNRVAHPSFPQSVCGVVFEGSQRSTGCQFTFTCDGSMLQRRPSKAAMARARAVAELALQGAVLPSVLHATHYHADYVEPWWSNQMVPLAKIGRHIFYRWPGKRGALSGQPSSVGEADLTMLARQSAKPLATSEIAGAARTEAGARIAAETLAIGETSPLAPASNPGDAIFFTVDVISPSGRWAVSALGRCAGKTGCRALAYESADQIARNSTVSAAAVEKPVFLFVRDSVSGIELALWDCKKVHRPTSSQCLPDAGQELERLLRGRQI